jgi:hypothetical protein
MKRAPIDTGGGRATAETDLQIARQVIDKSGVLAVLSHILESGVGRPRTLSLQGFLVAAQLNALHRHHQGHLVEIARALNAMTAEQLGSLDIKGWDPDEAYDRVERLFVSLCKVLEKGPVVDGVRVDAGWFANRIAAAAIPAKFRTSSSIAVDGTDLEAWGALHGDCTTVEFDGEAAETQLMEASPRRARRRGRLVCWP